MGGMKRTLAAATMLAAALSGCTGTNAVSQGVAGSNGYISGDMTLHWVAPADRSHVGTVRGKLLDGREFDLAQWQGHVIVVNFWESDCAPCWAETDALNQVYADTRAQGVQFLGVDTKEANAPRALQFDRAHHVAYPSLYDPDTTIGLAFAPLTPVATPTTIVLDRQGRIAALQSGEILFTQLRGIVDRVLAEPA
jgi:peroxiredoxin